MSSRSKEFKLVTDWNLYKLILFNVIQNSIKYNKKNGSIYFGLDLQLNAENKYVLTTIISDTGIGIDPVRLKFMCKSYEELLDKSYLSEVKDHGIGLGLSNSLTFATKLGGSLQITSSTSNGTIIDISIPVDIKHN